MAEVKVAFLARFQYPILSGAKTLTSRNSKLGEEGDTFTAWEVRFVFIHVYRERIETVAQYLYDKEGLATPDEFRRIWAEIHQGRGYVSVDRVWVHSFVRAPEDGTAPRAPQRILDAAPSPTPILPLADPGGTFRHDGPQARHP